MGRNVTWGDFEKYNLGGYSLSDDLNKSWKSGNLERVKLIVNCTDATASLAGINLGVNLYGLALEYYSKRGLIFTTTNDFMSNDCISYLLQTIRKKESKVVDYSDFNYEDTRIYCLIFDNKYKEDLTFNFDMWYEMFEGDLYAVKKEMAEYINLNN